jgi:jumonji domain-containing protein 2
MSLMDSCAGSWNLSNLESVLTYSLESPISGVNTPYCYVGSWKTLFCWHTEDLELSAINYLHDGKSKFWYSIPQNQHHIIEKEANKLFSEHFAKCPEYLRHKTTVINPYILKQKYPELKITKIEHKAGEFVLNFGGSYHCGFNFGFNLAEAVNYATLGWLKLLPNCQSCKCANDSVKISSTSVLETLLKCIYFYDLANLRNAKEVQDFRKEL